MLACGILCYLRMCQELLSKLVALIKIESSPCPPQDDDFITGGLLGFFEDKYEGVLNGYFNWMAPVLATIPFMVLPGNHESECHSPRCLIEISSRSLALRNFTAFEARWRMPSGESGGVGNMW